MDGKVWVISRTPLAWSSRGRTKSTCARTCARRLRLVFRSCWNVTSRLSGNVLDALDGKNDQLTEAAAPLLAAAFADDRVARRADDAWSRIKPNDPSKQPSNYSRGLRRLRAARRTAAAADARKASAWKRRRRLPRS